MAFAFEQHASAYCALQEPVWAGLLLQKAENTISEDGLT